MTARQERRAAPRGEPEIRAAALREKLLIELAKHNRTTLQLAAILEVERQVAYRALLVLEELGKIASFADLGGSVTGRTGRVWSLAEGGKEVQPPPEPDPLLWALFWSPP